MKKLNQNGFGFIDFLLLLILVGAVVFVYWQITKTDDEVNDANRAALESSAQMLDDLYERDPNLPVNLTVNTRQITGNVEYTVQEAGLVFSAPDYWDEPIFFESLGYFNETVAPGRRIEYDAVNDIYRNFPENGITHTARGGVTVYEMSLANDGCIAHELNFVANRYMVSISSPGGCSDGSTSYRKTILDNDVDEIVNSINISPL